MSARLKLTGFLMAGLLCLPLAAETDTQTTHRAHKVKKATLPPPLPSGTRGPVPQVPLDAMPAVTPQVSFQDGLLTIVAPNSTLGDILRGVRKNTAADIDIPTSANERVATRLGPGPAREVVAELLNGSHFNYILLGSPENANSLVRVVLVAKTGPDTPDGPSPAEAPTPAVAKAADASDADTPDEAVDESADQAATEADQTPSDQPGVKTPQQMLQEMQQRQLQLQQQQQQQQQPNAQPPAYPPPGAAPAPQRPPQQQ